MTKTIDEQIACVIREIKMRQRVYPKWCHDGRMTQEKAAHEISCMEEILRTLSQVRIKSLSVNQA